MRMRIPALRHSAIAAGTSARGGSTKPSRPRNSKLKSCWLRGRTSPVQRPRATPSTRSPRSAMASTWARMTRAASSGRWHRSITASGAPLVASRCRSGAPAGNTRVIARICGDRPYSNSADHSACTCSVPSSQRWPKAWIAFSIGSNGSTGVASIANSTRAWKSSGSSLAPSSRNWPSLNCNSATCMRLRVRVPVLSTANTEIAPSASTAGTRRVSTLRWAIRQAPRARNTVRMTGISSGRIAMIRAMLASRLSIRA